MNSGQSCAEVTVVQGSDILIGVGRPTLDPSGAYAHCSWRFWGVGNAVGELFHSGDPQDWQGMQGYDDGDVLRLLLDSDAGTLTVKKNGTLLGVAATSGLTGDLCWAVSMFVDHEDDEGLGSVRIKPVDPAEF
jgi:hypothetical protein